MSNDIHQQATLIFDGACGTTLQAMDIPGSVWGEYEGCNEYLNIAGPEIISAMHKGFAEAGADVLETNTFGASPMALAEYGLEDRCDVINKNAVEIAREATNQYVAGSIGPGKLLPVLGQVDYRDLYDSYFRQSTALVKAGVDILALETSQDILQLKICAIAVTDALKELNKDIPVMASMTFEQSGVMLTGSGIDSAVTTLKKFPFFSIGINCATGPKDMEPVIRRLRQKWDGRISCLPNQGLPVLQEGKLCYTLSPVEFADQMEIFHKEFKVNILGGCCGSTPRHIAELKQRITGAAA